MGAGAHRGRPQSAVRTSCKENDDDEPVSSGRDRGGHDDGRQYCAGARECLPSQYRAGPIRARREAERRGQSRVADPALGGTWSQRSSERVSVLRTAGLLLERQSLYFGHDRLRNLRHAHGGRLHDQGHSELLVVTSSHKLSQHGGDASRDRGEFFTMRLLGKGRIPSLVILGVVVWLAVPAQAADDPFSSWNDGSAKQAIIAFVAATTDPASPHLVTPGVGDQQF